MIYLIIWQLTHLQAPWPQSPGLRAGTPRPAVLQGATGRYRRCNNRRANSVSLPRSSRPGAYHISRRRPAWTHLSVGLFCLVPPQLSTPLPPLWKMHYLLAACVPRCRCCLASRHWTACACHSWWRRCETRASRRQGAGIWTQRRRVEHHSTHSGTRHSCSLHRSTVSTPVRSVRCHNLAA
jgi:hypothetical protein